MICIFQSTLLMRGATWAICVSTAIAGISIHAPHARSDGVGMKVKSNYFISIHAPHARSDCWGNRIDMQRLISIHAPHARSDNRKPDIVDRHVEFQSTLLMRGATCHSWQGYHRPQISIHAPHARSDERQCIDIAIDAVFQSTLLMRGAT